MKMLLPKQIMAGAAMLALMALAATPAFSAVSYLVTVDTNSVSGTSGFVELQFNPGNNTSQPATAQVFGFAPGGTLTGVPSIAGNVTGVLPATLTLVNSTAFNDYFHGIIFGSKITFVVVLSGPAIDSPNGTATAGSTFSISLFDAAQNVILSDQAFFTGAAGQIDINLNGTTTPTAFPNGARGPTVVTFTQQLTSFLIHYFANLTSAAGSVINLTNSGETGAPLGGPGFGSSVGNICVNAYAFSPDEQLISCCSCLVTPNALASLSIQDDLVFNTLTGIKPNSIVVKLLSTSAGPGSNSCLNSAASAGGANFPGVGGLVAFGTTVHAGVAAGTFAVTETPFIRATLSPSELASITNRCTNIVGNGSGFGVCRSCRNSGSGSSRN